MSSTNRRLFVAAAAAIVIGGGAYYLMGNTSGGQIEVAPLSVAQMRAKGGLIVDIRRPDEWVATGVIEGAVLATFDDPATFMAEIHDRLAPGQPLILVCQSGNRSGRAANALAGQIDNPIISVAGGMGRLMSEGYQTVAPN